uniref:Glutaredoxin domain-containing protein n=1 Tax=Phaeocystis antarctica TaxID=33657 RepID=A0A7S0EUU3_9EUKA
MRLLLLLSLQAAAALQLPARAPTANRAPTVQMGAEPFDPRIEELIGEHKVMLFMKGNKMFPQCGFSNTVVQILNACETPFETFDVLGDQRVREDIKRFSSWPTIPQVYVEGEFLGGCDVMIEMYQSGELAEILEKANAS